MWKFFADLFSGQRSVPVIKEQLKLTADQLTDAQRRLAEIEKLNAELTVQLRELQGQNAKLAAQLAELRPADLPEFEHQILAIIGQAEFMEEYELRKKFTISRPKFDLHFQEVRTAGLVVRRQTLRSHPNTFWELTQKGRHYLDQRGLL